MESKRSPLKWEYVLVGAVPGILMGSVGALAATPDDVSVELDTESEENDAEVVTFVPEKELEGLTVASVDDAMSFEDAFAEANLDQYATDDDLNLLAVIFTQLGDTLTTIAVQRNICNK